MYLYQSEIGKISILFIENINTKVRSVSSIVNEVIRTVSTFLRYAK